MWVLNPIYVNIMVWAWFPFARHYLGNCCFTFFSSGYLDGSVPQVPLLHTMCSCADTSELPHGVFPHSEIFGSQLICNSPKLIAAYHVFHRRLVPRHPPYALSSFIKWLLSTFFVRVFANLHFHVNCLCIIVISIVNLLSIIIVKNGCFYCTIAYYTLYLINSDSRYIPNKYISLLICSCQCAISNLCYHKKIWTYN